VLITDAATNRHAAVWDAFDRVRPRIMALGLDSTGAFGRHPRREQDLMQDWARVMAATMRICAAKGRWRSRSIAPRPCCASRRLTG
jgi:hypothetical protein